MRCRSGEEAPRPELLAAAEAAEAGPALLVSLVQTQPLVGPAWRSDAAAFVQECIARLKATVRVLSSRSLTATGSLARQRAWPRGRGGRRQFGNDCSVPLCHRYAVSRQRPAAVARSVSKLVM